MAYKAGTILRDMNLNFDGIYASPLTRTLQTAEQISRALDAEVDVLPGIAQCAIVIEAKGLIYMRDLIPCRTFFNDSKISFTR